MTTVRWNHTATLLPDGRVLVTGGASPDGVVLASAEIYDPSTRTFTATGPMATARRSHTATLLPDGMVLIAGGSAYYPNPVCPLPSSCGPLASAEIYDPSTGTFTPTGNMTLGGNASGGGLATLLPSGKVFVAVNLVAQLYDPTSGLFAATGPYADETFGVYTAALLSDGRVLIQGCELTRCETGGTELYDPVTNTFSIAGPMNGGEVNALKAILLMDGKVLFVGSRGTALPAEFELYDPAIGKFTQLGNTIWPHDFSSLTVLFDGTVLIAGGYSDSAELYDPVLGRFSATGNMTRPRIRHKATLLLDGTVLITGGETSSAELYCPVTTKCPPDAWQEATERMKVSAGTNALNFWQWSYFWQNTRGFSGDPAGFGTDGSISADLMDRITKVGGGDPTEDLSAEQWVLYYRQVAQADVERPR